MAQKKYLGFIIAGAVVSASGGSLLAMGLTYAWMGGFIQSMAGSMGGMPPFQAIFGVMGIGMAIGGGIALVVGLSLLGTGVSKRNAYKAATAQTGSAETSWKPETSTGREYAYTPSPAYGTISTPVATAAPVVVRCRSCGETLPERTDAQFCPNCGAPTR